ncbi:hypothetical protein CYY_009007 [Polysphondylium violaceum]|uniref:NOT2/NOT3/NOT5 C-terminal domain-containing protein n=1 Tax=Polysphondylium violaceum TaxID=133409 RepID=A0A8J4V0U5_9MYCE|nr:hypothetical protein CYY_009007 [Polysphondylium violaceum]
MNNQNIIRSPQRKGSLPESNKDKLQQQQQQQQQYNTGMKEQPEINDIDHDQQPNMMMNYANYANMGNYNFNIQNQMMMNQMMSRQTPHGVMVPPGVSPQTMPNRFQTPPPQTQNIHSINNQINRPNNMVPMNTMNPMNSMAVNINNMNMGNMNMMNMNANITRNSNNTINNNSSNNQQQQQQPSPPPSSTSSNNSLSRSATNSPTTQTSMNQQQQQQQSLSLSTPSTSAATQVPTNRLNGSVNNTNNNINNNNRGGVPMMPGMNSSNSQTFSYPPPATASKSLNSSKDNSTFDLNEFPMLSSSSKNIHSKSISSSGNQIINSSEDSSSNSNISSSSSNNNNNSNSNNNNSNNNNNKDTSASTNTNDQLSENTTGEKDNIKYGILGILKVIKNPDSDLSKLSIGLDLTDLGLNLSTSELYNSFGTPWIDYPIARKPEYYIPLCYSTPGLDSPTFKMNLFTYETLFYIFYSMPKDVLQIHAALELYDREWRYHKEGKIWLTKVQGTESNLTSTFEIGSFFFFDVAIWETVRRDNFFIPHDLLETKESLLAQIKDN